MSLTLMKSSFKARTFWIWQLPLDNQKCFCFIDVVVVTFLTNRQNVCSSGWLPFKAEAWSYWPSNDRIFFLRPVRHKLTKGTQFIAISFVFSFEDPGYSWSIYRYPQTCYNCCSFQRNNVLNVFFSILTFGKRVIVGGGEYFGRIAIRDAC